MTPTKVVTQEDVLAELKRREVKIDAPAVKSLEVKPAEFALTDAASALLALGGEETAPVVAEKQTAEKESIPVPPLADPALSASTDFLSLQLQNPQLGKIEVTEVEKKAFLRSAMNDERLVFEIPLFNNSVIIKVRSVLENEMDLMSSAVELEQQAGTVSGMTWITRMQQYCLALQIVDLPNSRWQPLDFNSTGRSDRLCELIAFTEEHIAPLSQTRYISMLRAWQIFEQKHKLCLDAFNDGGFWKPADTA